MTILAGVISRHPSALISDSVCESLRNNMSRHPDDKPIEFRDNKVFLLKIDIGAFGFAGHSTMPTQSFSMLAGEPLLTGEGPTGPRRDEQLAFLQTEWEQEKFQSLRSTSGTFCAVHYNASSGTTHLITDRLGLRPIFYSVLEDYIYFSSALRILEGMPEIPKIIDVQAVTEMTGFGYAFGNATPYKGIKTLLPCEIATHHQGALTSSKYFEWDTLVPLKDSETTLIKKTDQLFKDAVHRRLHGDRTTFAYLSGGLDSRCVVAALLAEKSHTYTFNFSLEKTQDQVFARAYAQQVGTIHQETPTNPGPNWSAIMAKAWHDSPYRSAQQPEHPKIVWTGEGGSVGLGHVYITPEIVQQLRAGDTAGAIDTFLDQQKKAISSRILAPSWSIQFKDHLREKLLCELSSIKAQRDPVRTFYIFLNLNGPRRHLFNHFESIDQHRLEYQVPFYDGALMEYLTAAPAEPFLYHRLYVEWLDCFDRTVKNIPWQAYPGHVACSVDIPEDLPDQWTAPATIEHQEKKKMELLTQSALMLADKNFPTHLLRKHYLRLTLWAWKLKLRDYSYALKAALAYYQYWKNSGLVRLRKSNAD
jgi:asparagine synthase (glutamine-hydrolysing)